MSNQDMIKEMEKLRWKNFLVFFKKHRFINPEGIIGINRNKEESTMKLIINRINGVAVNEQQPEEGEEETKFYAILSMTFFSKMTGAFFGRTYKSKPIELMPSDGGSNFATFDFHCAYFYSKVENPSDVILVMELEVKEINVESQTVKFDNLVGWSFIENPLSPTPESRQNFYRGTARNAYNIATNDSKGSQLSTSFQYEIVNSDSLKNAVKLFPHLVMVGSDEVLPGLELEKFPNSKAEEDIALSNMSYIGISKVRVTLSPDIENAVLDDCRNFRREKYQSEQQKTASDVYISDRRLVCSFHNGWTAINKDGFNHFISLAKGADNQYINDGLFAVDSVFMHPLSCLVFQLDFIVKIPLDASREETKNVTLSWRPYFMDAKMLGNTARIDKNMFLGPGKTLNFVKLFEMQGKNERTLINFQCDINLRDVTEYEVPHFKNETRAENKQRGRDTLELMQLKEEYELRIKEQQRVIEMHEAYKDAQDEKVFDRGKGSMVMEESRKFDNERSDPHLSVFSKKQYVQHQAVLDPSIQNEIHQLRRKFLFGNFLIVTVNNVLKNTEQMKKSYAQPQSLKHDGYYPGGRIRDPRDEMSMRDSRMRSPDYDISLQESHFRPSFPHQQDARYSMDQYRQTQPARQPPRRHQNNVGTSGIEFMRELPRGERAKLINYEIGGLLDKNYEGAEHRKPIKLEREFDDSRKISIFTVQIMAVRYFGDRLTGQPICRIPRNLIITFNFFDFPLFKSKTLSYLNKDLKISEVGDDELLEAQLYLINQDYSRGAGSQKNPCYNFEVDPTKTETIETHERFIKYLNEKTLYFDIWDGDSLMHFGQARVNLSQMLRQGRESEIKSFALDIISTKGEVLNLGELQITLKNKGIELPRTKKIRTMTKTSFNATIGSKNQKKKVRSFKPMDITQELSKGLNMTSRSKQEPDEEKRKLMRLQRYKMIKTQTARSPASGFTSAKTADQDIFFKTLREIEVIRERKKHEVIKNALRGGFGEEIEMIANYAECKYITYSIENNSRDVKDYRIKIDRGNTILNTEEFNVISNPREWKKVSDFIQSEVPMGGWDVLETGTVVSLNPRESVEIVFRFLSYDDKVLEADPTGEKLVKRCGFTITENNGRVIGGLNISFELKPPVVDKTIRFYELESRHASLEVPALFSEEANIRIKPHAFLTYAKARLVQESMNDIVINCRTPPAPEVLKFFMPVYVDSYRSELLGLFAINIHSQLGYDRNIKMGELFTLKLNVQTSIPRMVKLYVSDSKLAAIHKKFEGQFTVIPNNPNEILVNVRSFRSGEKYLNINCVETHSKELVQGWTFIFNASPSDPTKNIKEHVPAAHTKMMKYEFKHEIGQYSGFTMVSSNPEIVEPMESRFSLKSGEKIYLKFKIKGMRKEGIYHSYIYINDDDNYINECWKFKIQVQDQ